MDNTEKILKLAALGWDGKEPELEFFHRVYDISADIILMPGSEMAEIVLAFKMSGKNCESRIKIKRKNKKIDLTRYCLRLFRTVDGNVKGPSSAIFIENYQEWT
jgi:hypothetical protein